MMTDEVFSEAPVVVLKRRRAQPFFGRHPWVFAGAIDRVRTASSGELSAGTQVQLHAAEGEVIAWGLYNPDSNIRVRLYSWDRNRPIDEDLLGQRIQEAVACRRQRYDLTGAGTACRLVFSEGDGLSGLTADWYAGYLLVQFTSRALYRHRDLLIRLLTEQVRPRGVWMRTEKGIREQEGLEVSDGPVAGEEPPRPLFISEGDVQFGVDVQQGQKTGFYLDQRTARQALTRYTRGHRILDAFCFSGGFGLSSLVCGQADRCVGLDSSSAALRLAVANAELNGVADRYECRRGDVKRLLADMAEQGEQFDTVVLDPPRLARTRAGLRRALRAYEMLNRQALAVLRPGGILTTCSCSGLVSREQFLEVIAETARHSGRHIRILETFGQPDDHPVSAVCPETAYLKVCLCQVS